MARERSKTVADPFAQVGYDVRFDWGLEGLGRVASGAAVVVVVDVLRFSTTVCVACERGATVAAGAWTEGDDRLAIDLLSPVAARQLPVDARVEIPSPNGAALVRAAVDLDARVVLAGSLRNAHAVGRYARATARDGVVVVVAAGEQGRPAVEDLLGAGAVVAATGTDGLASPEAEAAAAAFLGCTDVEAALLGCASRRELVVRGLGDDVAMAGALDVSNAVPLLVDGAFADAAAS